MNKIPLILIFYLFFYLIPDLFIYILLKIWFEDLKTPIIKTRYHGSYLTDGCFSPTRHGVFFLTRKVKIKKILIKIIS